MRENKNWYSIDVKHVLNSLDSDTAGLVEGEAKRRTHVHRKNLLPKKRKQVKPLNF